MKWEDYSKIVVIQAGYGYTYNVTEARCSNCKKYSSQLWQYAYEDYEHCPHCGEKAEP